MSRTQRLWGLVRRIGQPLHMDIVPRNYYSPIPDIAALPESVWSEPSSMSGLDWDLDAQLEFARRELADEIRGWTPPEGFDLDNPTYGSVDAEILYGMIRSRRPALVMELGSGQSSLIAAQAARRNRQEGSPCTHEVFDPFPWLAGLADADIEVREISVTDIPLAEFGRLGSGDILFVDTTHTVKVGGDVNRLILDVLPTLAPGVVVHFHDIFLPWEYPREWVVDHHFYWAEQHLLQAFLAFNDRFQILLSAHALWHHRREELSQLIPSCNPAHRPAAFWIRRVGAPSAGA